MSMRTELAINYDSRMHPLSARCKECGAAMRSADPKLKDPIDIILWFSQLYVEHRRAMHVPANEVASTPR
jgi:hypothetical protein